LTGAPKFKNCAQRKLSDDIYKNPKL
jgi:hypothetical protein